MKTVMLFFALMLISLHQVALAQYKGSIQKENPVSAEVYPNPSSTGFLQVSLKETDGPVSIEIYNLLGHLVSRRTAEASGVFLFDLKEQPQGIYFVYLKSEGAQQVIKFQLN